MVKYLSQWARSRFINTITKNGYGKSSRKDMFFLLCGMMNAKTDLQVKRSWSDNKALTMYSDPNPMVRKIK